MYTAITTRFVTHYVLKYTLLDDPTGTVFTSIPLLDIESLAYTIINLRADGNTIVKIVGV